MKKRIIATVLAATMALGLMACGSQETASTGGSGDLIKVGIINNDPNESG